MKKMFSILLTLSLLSVRTTAAEVDEVEQAVKFLNLVVQAQPPHRLPLYLAGAGGVLTVGSLVAQFAEMFGRPGSDEITEFAFDRNFTYLILGTGVAMVGIFFAKLDLLKREQRQGLNPEWQELAQFFELTPERQVHLARGNPELAELLVKLANLVQTEAPKMNALLETRPRISAGRGFAKINPLNPEPNMKSWLCLSMLVTLAWPTGRVWAETADQDLVRTVEMVNARLRSGVPKRVLGYLTAGGVAWIWARAAGPVPHPVPAAVVTTVAGPVIAVFELERFIHVPRFEIALPPAESALLHRSVARQIEAARADVGVAEFYRGLARMITEQITRQPTVEFKTRTLRP